jgi:glycerol uptake operon antiterminator
MRRRRDSKEEGRLQVRVEASRVRPSPADSPVQRLLESFDRFPVAAAIKRAEDLPRALASQVPAVFFLRAPAFHIGPLVWAAQARGKKVFVHIDLVAGLGKDHAGVAFLTREIGVNGIISSHSGLIAAAKADRVIAIQRLLLHDDLLLPQVLHAIDRAQPDIVEVLPGVLLPEIGSQLRERITVPMLAGGFIATPQQVRAAVGAGARAVTTSSQALWT